MYNVDKGRIRPCTGCFACSGICPRGAIQCVSDTNGFYSPHIDSVKCVECGLCRTVCYSHKDQLSSSACLKAYYGWHRDDFILSQSASGGITVALCQHLMDVGYWVIGCSYDNALRKAKHVLLKQPQDISKISGSKYFQSDLTEVVDLLHSISKDQKLAFFGTPCQIIGMKDLLRYKGFVMESVLLVELFCHGIVSPMVWQSYLDVMYGGQEIEDIHFRTKRYGWHIPTNEFVTKKHTIPTLRTGDLFFEAFYSTEYYNQSCYRCEARKNIGNADIRIGDYWGQRFKDNKKGVSCIITSSDKGDMVLNDCRKYFELFEGDLKDILSGQSYNIVHPFNEDNWMRNYEILKGKGLKKSIKQVRRRIPFRIRTKRAIFQVLSNMKHRIIE